MGFIKSSQLGKQRLCISQDRHVEAFGKPFIDWHEELTRLDVFALVAPKSPQVDARAQLPKLRALMSRHRERLAITFLRCSPLTEGEQSAPPHPIHLGLSPTFLCRFHQLRRVA